jgi:hypothetical protein
MMSSSSSLTRSTRTNLSRISEGIRLPLRETYQQQPPPLQTPICPFSLIKASTTDKPHKPQEFMTSIVVSLSLII